MICLAKKTGIKNCFLFENPSKQAEMINNTEKNESEIQSDKDPEGDETIVYLPKCEPKALG